MLFVVLGVALLLMNLLGVGFAAAWSWPGDWWKMCWPFGLALLWWAYSDSSGLTKRRAMDRMELRKLERRRKQMTSLGLNPRDQTRLDQLKRAERASKSKVERERAEQRQRQRDTITRSSRLDSRASKASKVPPGDDLRSKS